MSTADPSATPIAIAAEPAANVYMTLNRDTRHAFADSRASAIPRSEWDSTRVAAVMHTDTPTGSLRWTLRRAVQEMKEADTDRLVIVNDGAFIGVVTTGEILKLDAILDRAEDPGFARSESARLPTVSVVLR
jgi:signal-transduction protein with cAMP-binding, CBS, and nucleotidyltransferase domain